MKTQKLLAWLLVSTAAVNALADGDPKPKRDPSNPTSKLFVASVKGESSLNNADRIRELAKTNAFTAENSVIETKEKSFDTMVYSNGTGLYMDENTRLEIKKFEQEPFNSTRNDVESEPSISQTQAYLANGFVGICTPKMVAGSSMVYNTALGSAQIRARQMAIETDAKSTTIYALEGDVTVRAGTRDLGGRVIQNGEMAVITPGAPGQPNVVTVSKMDQKDLDRVNDKVSGACRAKRTVVWDTVTKKTTGGVGNSDTVASDNRFAGLGQTDNGGKQITPTPVVPVNLPVAVTTSDDRIR